MTGAGRAGIEWRLAQEADIPAIRALMKRAIEELQTAYLSPEEIAASHACMGLDTQLIEDGTYFIVTIDGESAGCGGWGRRATLYGGDHTTGRSETLLDPARDPARIRAMYTHPHFTRRGVGKLILALAEAAAGREGFKRLTLGATLAGEPLYRACGFRPVGRSEAVAPSGVAIPVIAMERALDLAAAERTIAQAGAANTAQR